MGKCQKCYSYFPPQYMREIEGAKIGDFQCIYCERGKDYVTIIKDDNSGEEKYTKKQCISDYKLFLKKLKESSNVAEKIAKRKIEPT